MMNVSEVSRNQLTLDAQDSEHSVGPMSGSTVHIQPGSDLRRAETRPEISPYQVATTAASTSQSEHRGHPVSGEGYAAATPKEPTPQNAELTAAKKDLAFLTDIVDGFFLIEQQFGGLFNWGLNDGKLILGDIEAAAADKSAPGHDAAVRLLRNPRMRSLIDANSDKELTSSELNSAIDGLKAKIAALEKASAEAAAPPPSNPGGSTTQGTTSSTQETSTTAETGNSAPPEGVGQHPMPPPSTRPGLDGTVENLGNSLDWLQDEMKRKGDEAAKNPEKATQLNAEISRMSSQFQTLANMLNQINTMMSNLSKLWSDISMNSIRNFK